LISDWLDTLLASGAAVVRLIPSDLTPPKDLCFIRLEG